MASDFDALKEWLGIPESQRPPNHYALLGLPLLEGDSERIADAYHQQYRLVRQYEVGTREEAASQVLEERSKAFRILSNLELKHVYDQALKSSLGVAVSNSKSRDGSFTTTNGSTGPAEQVFETSCPNARCHVTLRLRRSMAGARARCNKCGARLEIGDDLTVILLSETPTLSEAHTETRVETPDQWDSLDVEQLSEASDRLREQLTDIVVQGDAKELVGVHTVREFKRKHAELAAMIGELEYRGVEIQRQHKEFAGIIDELTRREDELTQQHRELQSLHEPLGEASYQGLLNGHLRDQPLFLERKACGDRTQRLRDEYDHLSQASTLLEKAKAKAQQAVIWGKLRIEQSHERSANAKIGRELIETGSIDLVKCHETEEIVSKLRRQLTQTKEIKESVDEANSRLEAKKSELQTSLGLAEVRSPHQLAKELARCNKEITTKQSQLSSLTASLPDLLLEVADNLPRSEDSDLYASLKEFGGITQALRAKEG